MRATEKAKRRRSGNKKSVVRRKGGKKSKALVASPVSSSDSSKSLDVFALKQQINSLLSRRVLKLDASANTISSATAVYSKFYGFKGQPEFLDPWTKYGEKFISPATMKLVKSGIGIEELNRKIAERLSARVAKDWKVSDDIRNELVGKGITLKDTKDPTTGEPTTTWEIAQ
jgi:cysteinyl-tRNA synthetase